MRIQACRAAVAILSGLATALAAQGASVSLSSDVTTVAQGGSVSFTVTVTPSTYVAKVLLSYGGEAGQDEDTLAPYTFSHTFDTPGDGIGVLATVIYNQGDPNDTAGISIDVVGMTLAGNLSPMRGWVSGYTAESNPPGKAVDQFEWTYSWGTGSNQYLDYDNDNDDVGYWSGRMVVDGTLACSATISGVAVAAESPVIITPRVWPVPITCVQDNEPGWGSQPTANAALGMNRDRDSDARDVFVPRLSADSWDLAFTTSQVTSGPCQGWWYVSSSTLRCQRETVISKYIKPEGPTLGGVNFHDVNDDVKSCFTSTGADFVQAVMNHEYQGTPSTAKSLEGHQGRYEKAILDNNHDAKQHIEVLTKRDQASLILAVNDAILADEQAVESFGEDESYMTAYGPNWGYLDYDALGVGASSRWDPGSASWTSCVNGPDNF